MRKFMIVLTIAASYFVAIGTMSADAPPGCTTCPWVR